MTAVRIVLIDDHAILRSGVRLMLEQQPDLEVIGEAATVPEGIALAKNLEPDIVVLDLSIPGGGGAGIQAVRTAFENARVVVLTMHEEPAIVDEAIASGADGFVTKASAASDLVLAIRAVARGQTFFKLPLRGLPAPPPAQLEEFPLSPREIEVLAGVAAGYTNKEVAAQLDLSIKTVETYRARIGEKTGLKSRVEILRYALDHGLVGKTTKGG